MAKTKKHTPDIPQYEIEILARCLLPEIQKYYESEEGKLELKQWKEKTECKTKNKK